jgi:tetratricopeptide (TPR) repeat protein
VVASTKFVEDLEKALQAGTKAKLKTYSDPQKWNECELNDRSTMARVLVKQAEALFAGDASSVKLALECIRIAEVAATHDVAVRVEIVLMLISAAQSEHIKVARDIAERVVDDHPKTFLSWYGLAAVLHIECIIYDDPQYGRSADEVLKVAELFWTKDLDPEGKFYMDYASILFSFAKRHGEVVDYQRVIERLEQAKKVQPNQLEDYWRLLLNTYLALNTLLPNDGYVDKVLEIARKMAKVSPELNLYREYCNALHTKYVLTHDNAIYHEASTVFDKATKMGQSLPYFYYLWGQLCLEKGKITSSLEYLEEAEEKFQKTHELNIDDPSFFKTWADLLTFIGSRFENLDSLIKAQSLIQHAIDKNPNDYDSWMISGFIHYQIATYFQDEAYYKKALEVVDKALALFPESATFWHQKALITAPFSLIYDDPSYLEQADELFAKAEELSDSFDDTLINDWGCTLIDLHHIYPDESYAQKGVEKFEELLAYCEEASLEPTAQLLCNAGIAWGFYGHEDREPAHFEKAIEYLSEALQQDPNLHQAAFHLGLAYSDLGEEVNDLESFKKAAECLESYLKHESEDEAAWIAWGLVLMHIALLMHDPVNTDVSHRLMVEAEKRFQRAVTLGSGRASLCLAFLAFLHNRITDTMLHLERAKTALGPDITPDEMLEDPLFDGLQNIPEFGEFIKMIEEFS